LNQRIIICLLLILVISCKNGKHSGSGHAVARVYEEYLYSSDLVGIIPRGTAPKDSIEITRNYIDNWITQRLVAHKAEHNLNAQQKDFAKQLEDYRNSLITYQYESKLIRQKIDTVVSAKEIEDYYNNHQNNFELKDNIVKVVYVKLKAKDPNLGKVKGLIRSNHTDDRDKLEILCKKAAVNFYLDDQSWLLFNDLLKEIPIQTYDQEAYLQNHRYIEINDEQFTYLVNFTDFKIKESVSPLSFETENIRNIIVNKRKLKLISDMQQDVYKEATKNKDFEVY
jgi:hypothetical protein